MLLCCQRVRVIFTNLEIVQITLAVAVSIEFAHGSDFVFSLRGVSEENRLILEPTLRITC
jgi:hypothetical protein